jgi:hypothetical protein
MAEIGGIHGIKRESFCNVAKVQHDFKLTIEGKFSVLKGFRPFHKILL